MTFDPARPGVLNASAGHAAIAAAKLVDGTRWPMLAEALATDAVAARFAQGRKVPQL